MPSLDELIRERVREEMESRQNMRSSTLSEMQAIKNLLGGGGPMRSAGADYSVYDRMGGGMEAPPGGGEATMGGGISPEDYNYFVDIQRRAVMDPQTQEEIGWDKKVHRWADPRNKAPSIGDLTDESMKSKEQKRRGVSWDEGLGGY